eukprot:12424988-Karenia_brevis.AAC.1
MVPEDPVVAELCGGLEWSVVSQHEFSETSHVNFQEINELCCLVRHQVSLSLGGDRRVNVVDSQ